MPSIEQITTVFTYFNPTRSPYYTIALASCVGLFFACDVKDDGSWLWLAVPAYLVAMVTLGLSIDSRNNLSPEEHSEQLRFSRSTSISVAVLALTLAGRAIATSGEAGGNALNFRINLVICCLQLILFLLYSWALNKQEPSGAERNYVQITLVTSAFLGDTCWNLAQAADHGDPGYRHHQLTAYGLGLLWFTCFLFWVVKLKEIVIIQRVGVNPALPNPQSNLQVPSGRAT